MDISSVTNRGGTMTLTPAQQTLADQHFARMGQEARGHMGHGMGPGMGRPGPMGPGGPGPREGGPDMLR